MTEENRRAAIRLELAHGKKALEAASALRDLAMPNDALSRLYYAVFHHVVALLLTEGVEPTRHAALPALLGRHFVLAGALTANDVAIVSRIFAYRNLADYERTWDATPEIVDAAFAEAQPLLDRLRAIIAAGGWIDPALPRGRAHTDRRRRPTSDIEVARRREAGRASLTGSTVRR